MTLASLAISNCRYPQLGVRSHKPFPSLCWDGDQTQSYAGLVSVWVKQANTRDTVRKGGFWILPMGTFFQAQECGPAAFCFYLIAVLPRDNHWLSKSFWHIKAEGTLPTEESLIFYFFSEKYSYLYVCLNNNAHTIFSIRKSCEPLKDGLAMVILSENQFQFHEKTDERFRVGPGYHQLCVQLG